MKTFLQFIGLRTNCCNAKVVAWHHDKFYCQKCEKWLKAEDLPKPFGLRISSKPKTTL